MERHGEDFFTAVKQDAMRIYEEDREAFLTIFTKENLLRELNEQGVFITNYRLVDDGKPIYVNMKVTRMSPEGNKVILGVSVNDSQWKQQEIRQQIQRERNALTRVLALAEGYLSLYAIHPDTGNYIEYSASDEYERLGIAKIGEDFFGESIANIKEAIHPDDLSGFYEVFTKENVLREVREHGMFHTSYRLMIGGKSKRVVLKIASFMDGEEERLFAGVRSWRNRKN
jgi:hypothetical protein